MKLKIHKENSPIGEPLGEVRGVDAFIFILIPKNGFYVDFSSPFANLL